MKMRRWISTILAAAILLLIAVLIDYFKKKRDR